MCALLTLNTQVAASRLFVRIKVAVSSAWFDHLVDVLLVGNAVTLMLEEFKILRGGSSPTNFDG